MYLLAIGFENTCENGTGKIDLQHGERSLPKWTLLRACPAGRELLRLAAAACGGTSLIPRLPFDMRLLCGASGNSLQIECLLALHAPFDVHQGPSAQRAGGVRIERTGVVRGLKLREYRCFPSEAAWQRARTGIGNSWLFVLGYGHGLHHHDGTDDFDFTDPFFRLTRFHALFSCGAPLTDPVQFLARLHFRAVRHKRFASTNVFDRLASLAEEILGVDTRTWMSRQCDFRQAWSGIAPWQQKVLLTALDAARHLLCGFPRCAVPLDVPALILFDRPDLACTGDLFPKWVRFMDHLLPKAQFVITIADRDRPSFPSETLGRSLTLPVIQERPTRKTCPPCLPRETVLLLDVDSRLPNLALMKLSRHLKDRGKHVVLARHQAFVKGVEAVYASAVFSRPASQTRLDKLQRYYGDLLVAGGSGTDVVKRLPDEIEKLPPDYSLYPGFEDKAIGFLTRGCPFHCPFCIVPVKEGNVHQVNDLEGLLPGGRRNLILLDDNILAHPKAEELLESIALRNIQVCFTQTLDLRFVDRGIARLLKRIACSNLKFTRRVYHFSLNDARNLEEVSRKYRLFGFTSRDNVEFIFMYGFNTTLAEDLERLRFLRSLPGAYAFTQEYLPIPEGPPPNTTNFFDDRADQFIDELIRIVFTQNMKSVENYYRWVSRHYAQVFGRLHQGLVDAIFRYNKRQSRGHYMAEMLRLHGTRSRDGQKEVP
mgnify:CR=1 FL=1